ncbi:uncharacterized protein LOC114328733 [Diabrotica virgifera virgifera]|uniref:Uncharacterized protein LOC114328733 n=1 Tax=Diabrotica virgifera virgifera TaxID=50390 RepID=A0A6P7FF37_DIAVI|nr:uncharacterized protein LOC114328733 [Diabrotica virgifera virgifera]
MAPNRLCIIKIVELAIAIVCMVLHSSTHTADYDIDTTSAITYGAFIIILVGEAAAYFWKCPLDKKIDIYYSIVGCSLFLATGIFNILRYTDQSGSKNKTMGIIKALFSLVNGVVFALDAFLTYKGEQVSA